MKISWSSGPGITGLFLRLYVGPSWGQGLSKFLTVCSMKRYFVIYIIGILFLLDANIASSDEQKISQELEILRSRATELEAEWVADRSKIKTLRGELSAPSAAAPEAIVDQFLSDYADVFLMRGDPSTLEVQRVQDSPAGYHLSYKQTYEGLPVFNGSMEIHVARNGQISLVHNYFVPGINISPAPLLSEPEIINRALQDYLSTYRRPIDKSGRFTTYAGEELILKREIQPELGIFDDNGTLRLAFKLIIFAESPFGLVEYIVDASSGNILSRRNLVRNATGRGRVFDPNPVNRLNNTNLRDDDDAANPDVFNSAYRLVNLPDISEFPIVFQGRPLSFFLLSGPFVDVADIEPPSDNIVFSLSPDFIFNRRQQGFEAVMVYFHIDRNQRYIQSLGFNNINNRTILVDPHGVPPGFDPDNSFYVSSPVGAGYLLFGEGGVDDAEDADVIVHEYGHAIQDNQTNGKYNPDGEASAQGEGFGDYWAFSNNRPNGSFDPACFAEWDTEGACLRRLDTNKRYPTDRDPLGDPHLDGEIWSAGLREIFLALGKQTTDTIVLQSHFLVPDNPQFCDGVKALKDADRALFNGRNRIRIGSIMAQRGIGGDLSIGPSTGIRNATFPTAFFRLEVVNNGPCAVGPTTARINLISGSTDLGRVRTFTVGEIPAGQRRIADLSLRSVRGQCAYKVFLDVGNTETETDENNNISQSAFENCN
jgi:Fungalysin/Thermolysin Propeptide Motif/Fungalysin metallopeptidase (M36)